MAGGQINFKVGYTVDKTGLQAVKASIQEIMNMKPTGATEFDNQLKIAQQDAQALSNILNQSFNKDLGTINVQKFNNALKASGTDLNKIQASMTAVGQGNAFRSMAAQVLTTNMQLKQTHTLLDNMATTMANTVKWGIASSVMNTFSGKVKEAYGYVKSLDTSLNNIRIVTEKSADDMEHFARTANKAAKELAATTKEYTDAALIYYQQGDTDAVAQAKAEVTLKTANVTQQSADEVSEQLTAVWNGYKVSAQEAESYVDKLAAVAATTASDLEELSTGMSKVASAANSMGVDIDQLNAQLATIVSVTRQAPESVGTALKTIYARMGDLAVDGEDEFGVSLGEVSGKMEQMGIQIMDHQGNIRDMGIVIEETAAKWDTWTEAQKQAAAVAMAGKRQYNNLIALFDNWDMYTNALNTSQNALGTLSKQNDIYMESVEGHLNQLRTATEGFYDSLMDADGLNPMIDSLTDFMTLLDNITQSIGGLGPILLMLGATATKVFSKHIARGISTSISNMNVAKENAEALAATMELTNKFGSTGNQDKRLEKIVSMKREILKLGESVTNEEHELVNQLILQTEEIYKQQDALKQRKENLNLGIKQFTGDSKDVAAMTEKEKLEAKANLTTVKDDIQTDLKGLDDIIERGRIEAQITVNKTKQKALEEELVTLNNTQYETEEETEAALKRQAKIEQDLNDLKQQGNNLETKKSQLASGKDAIANTLDLIKTFELGEQATNTLNNAIDIYDADLEKIAKGTMSAEEANRKLATTLKGILSGSVKDIDKLLEELGFDFDNAEREAKEMAAGAEAAMNKLKNSLSQRNAIQDFTTVIGLVGQLSMAISSIVRLPSIWKDEDLSVGEKMIQTISGASMALMMFLPILNKKNIATLAGVAASIASKTSLLSETGAITLATIAEGNYTVASIAAAGGTTTLAGAIYTLLWPIGLVMAAIAAIVAVIAGFVAAIKAVIKEHEKEAQAAKDAAKATEDLTKKYNDCKQAADDLKQSISDYSDAIKALSSLTKGTEEYEGALEAANAKAKELIDTYGLYDKYFYKDGVITFEEGALEEAQEEARQKTNIAEQQMNASNVILGDARIEQQADELSKSFGHSALAITENIAAWTATGTAAGAAAGAPVAGVGAAPGAAAGAISGLITGIIDSWVNEESSRKVSDEQVIDTAEALNKLRDENFNENQAALETLITGATTFEDFKNKLKEEEIALDNAVLANIEAMWENKEGLLDFTNSLYEAEQANLEYSKRMLQGIIEEEHGDEIDKLATDKDGNVNEARASQISAILAQQNEKVAKKMQDKIDSIDIEEKTDWNSNNKLSNYGYEIDNDEDLARTYAEKVLGLNETELDYKKGNGKGTLKDASGNTVVDELSDEYMRKQLAILAKTEEIKAKYADELDTESDLEAIGKVIESATAAGEKYGTDFTDAILNSMTANGEMDFSSLYADLDPTEVAELYSMSDDDLYTMFGGEEALADLGFKKAEDFAKHFKDGLEGYEWNIDAALAKAVEGQKSELEAAELDTEEVTSYAKHLMEIAETSDDVADSLKHDAEAGVMLAKSIQRMNNGVEKLQENFEGWSDVLRNSSKESEEYHEALTGMQDAIGDLLDVEDEYVTDNFVQKHLGLIEEAANGSEDAINSLRNELAKETIMNIAIENGLAQGEIDGILSKYEALQNSLSDIEIKAGMDLSELGSDYDEFIAQMGEIIGAAGMTAEQANDLFSQMGYSAELETEEKEITEKVPQTVTETEIESLFPLKTKSKSYVDGETEITRTATVPKMITKTVNGKETKVPAIKSIHKKASGSFNNKSSKNKGDSSGNGKSKVKDLLENEKDIYHDINIEIKKLENSFNKLQSQQEKLYGQDLLNNLQQQLDLLERQEDAQRRKLEIAKQEANSLKSTLEKQGTKFNADGTIANYQSLYDQKLAYVNRVIASGDEEAAEAAKKEFEAWLESVERYDELISNEIPEIDQAIRDKINERIEKQIEAFEYKITLKLEVKDAERDWNDFKKEMLEDDDILGRAGLNLETFKTYLGDEGTINTLTEKSNTLLDQLKQINETGTSSIYGDNKAKLMEDLKAVQEELMSAMKDQKDILKEIEQAYFDMLDAAQEAFDEQIAQYEAINEVYSHGLNVVNLLYGEDAYAEMEGFYQKQMENNTQMIDMQKKTVDYYKGLLQNASLSDDEREEVQKRLQEAQAALHSSVESQIELIITKYQNAINKIFKTLEDKMSGGKGLSYIQEEWDLINQNAEMYLDEVNSAYEIEKLSREYNKAIDATDSLSAQRKLNELMEQQLKGLREKDKLTQYEVDRANALLDIELKRIALEEAQQNKSKMRLRRDASGNYSYQFVSDEDSVAQAQQELADAQNSLYNLDKDALQENQEAALNMWTEFKDKYMEIMSDVTLSDEEREARLQLIREQYGEMYNNLLMQNADIRKNLEETALEEMAQMNLDYTMEQIVPTWNSGVQQMMESFAGEGGLIPACSEAFGELTEITNQYAADLGVLEATAGYNLGNIAGYTTEVITEMTTVLSNNEELIAKYEEQHRQLELIRDTVAGLMGDYETLATNANAAADAIIRAREEEARSNPENNPPGDNGDGGDRPKDDGDNKNPVDNSSKVEGVAAAIWLDPNYAGWGSGATRASRLSSKGVAAAQSIIDSQGPNGQLYRKWWKKDRSGYKFGAFDTGGYTGDWTGNDGRVALLHKKELVLNDKDTKNILQAVDVVRQIDGIMSSIMGNAFAKVNNQINGLNSMNFPIGGPTSSETAVAQHIEINADFSGVEKASEIISAFENLTNMATQYAFKTDR